MRFDVSSELRYRVAAPSVLIFNIHALRTASQTVLEESLVIEPSLSHEEFVSSNGDSRFVRLETGDAKAFAVRYRARVDTRHELVDIEQLVRVPIYKLAHDIVPFLFPSRYCQSDRLDRFAHRHFGKPMTTYERVVAITEWVHANVAYESGSTNEQTSAFDTITQGAGVCRDFAHLCIALCRAMDIPARYFSGYAYRLDPPDFHAVFEAFVGGRWMLFDATRLVPLNGLVRIASGRDAADTSIATIFGSVQLESMTVSCAYAAGQPPFEPVTHGGLAGVAVSLDIA